MSFAPKTKETEAKERGLQWFGQNKGSAKPVTYGSKEDTAITVHENKKSAGVSSTENADTKQSQNVLPFNSTQTQPLRPSYASKP